ncbi:DUF6175 family protein [Arcticibacterium luteifluviistationis]|uniref:DUF4831 domain-containing protein n=1 Tax=Arcticibacterium luteifluviistationis TaxID=1784714 RepID=A0A2Z4G9U8_9BACT|nr:DUF6175 family protein [Arcticibacterium luteifluviistationis]AWV97693.1 hypothetical protein DJ013_05740 [Arcticibacterium luteifluviistationis]
MKSKIALLLILLSAVLANAQTGVKNPSIMIVPADNLLYQLGCLDVIENQGIEEIIPLYSKSLRENNELLLAIQAINNKFLSVEYPTKNLEQVIKTVDAERARNLVNGVRSDPRQLLLMNAKPDIKCDLSYEFKKGGLGSQLSFVLSATDAYSGDNIASIGSPGIPTTNNNIAQMIADQVERNMEGFLNDIQNHFRRVNENGRKMRLTIQVSEESAVDLENDECNGEFLSDLINDEIKKNSFKHQFSLLSVTDSEIRYQDIAIPLYGDDDIGIDARDWLKPLVGVLRRTCKYKVSDRTFGIADGLLIIN